MASHYFRGYLILCCLLILYSCRHTGKKDSYAFYHWKLQVNTPVATDKLGPQFNKTIYLHLMDVDIREGTPSAYPKAMLNIQGDNSLLKNDIIPVIFIHNRVMAQLDSAGLKDLAQLVVEKRTDFFKYFNISADLKELQIDCDWLASHKDKYFYFLECIRKTDPQLRLSATLRLYPYKYPKIMGIPPVDYAVLMCYNMDDIKSSQTTQSILDPTVLEQYIKGGTYPLELKAALPVFGWWAWFRNDSYQGILYLQEKEKNGNWLSGKTHFTYQADKDTVIQKQYIRKGDILRNEFPQENDLEKSIQLLKKHVHYTGIIYYHLDDNLLKHYETFF